MHHSSYLRLPLSPSDHAPAVFSPCRTYRYTLWRQWKPGDDYAMFIGLNPSTADEVQDDPTVRRCVGFARAWGYSALCMTNIFAFRATDPDDMKTADRPVGPDNNFWLELMALKAGVVVAAWGVHGAWMDRGQQVRQRLGRLHYLRLTKAGHPAHPLYLPGDLKPMEWREEP